MRHMRLLVSALVLFLAAPSWAQTPQRQTQEDDYTRYELLGPDTAQFRILYEVTATTAGAPYLLQRHPQGQHRHRRTCRRHDDGAAAEVGDRQRRAGAEGRAPDRRPRHRMVEGASGAAGAERRRSPRPHRQDLQGSEELFPRRRHDRVRSIAGHSPQRGRAAGGLSPDLVQRAVAGDEHGRWPRHDHVHEPRTCRGAARDSRQAGPGAVHAEGVNRARSAEHRHDGVAGRAPVGSRAPGSRDRLLPERSVDALLQPLPRLHGVASGHRSLLQHRPCRQHACRIHRPCCSIPASRSRSRRSAAPS